MADAERIDASVAAAIRIARRKAGLSQPAFATALGEQLGESFSRVALGNWENGRHKVPASVLLAAARIAGLSVDELLAGASAAGEERRRPEFTEEEARMAIETLKAIRLLLR